LVIGLSGTLDRKG